PASGHSHYCRASPRLCRADQRAEVRRQFPLLMFVGNDSRHRTDQNAIGPKAEPPQLAFENREVYVRAGGKYDLNGAINRRRRKLTERVGFTVNTDDRMAGIGAPDSDYG